MDDDWVRAYLGKAPHGVLATSRDGQPFINSNIFVYDPDAHAVYLHTARAGRTPSNVAGGTPVCFSCFSMGRLLPAEEALEFSVEYEGVVVFGNGCILDDHEESRHALQLLMDKYAPHLRPGVHYRPITDTELDRTAVYRIDISAWSGKKKSAPADFPGAFWYKDEG